MTHVRFFRPDGSLVAEGGAKEGSLLALAQSLGLPLEGTCGGQMACSTCHLYVAEADLGNIPPPCAYEEDMLDFTDFVAANSRLGCQIMLGEGLETLDVTLPPGHRDMQ